MLEERDEHLWAFSFSCCHAIVFKALGAWRDYVWGMEDLSVTLPFSAYYSLLVLLSTSSYTTSSPFTHTYKNTGGEEGGGGGFGRGHGHVRGK